MAPRKNTINKGIAFLKNEQEKDGSWFGRWGTNYIYGTWSVLHALKASGENMDKHGNNLSGKYAFKRAVMGPNLVLQH